MLIVNLNISSYNPDSTMISSQDRWRRIIETVDLEKVNVAHIDHLVPSLQAKLYPATFDGPDAWMQMQLPLWAAANSAMAFFTGKTEQTMKLTSIVLSARGNAFLKEVLRRCSAHQPRDN